MSDATTLTQGAWAALLAGRMGLSSALPGNASDGVVAAALLGGRGPQVIRDARAAQLLGVDGTRKTWRFEVPIPQTALWTLETRNTVPAFVSVDRRPSTLTPSAQPGALADVGVFPLVGGAHVVTVVAANLSLAPEIDLAAGCRVVSPGGGWSAAAPLTYGALARTLVQAIRQSSRLPAVEALPIVKVIGPAATVSSPGEGAYTLLVSGLAMAKASYRLDGCEESRPSSSPTADGWREGPTVWLTGGDHTVSFFGLDATRNDGRVRLVRRSTAEVDYLAVLQSMGVKLGPSTASLERGHSVLLAALEPLALFAPADSDPFHGLAGKTVSKGDAEAILDTPAIARLMKNGIAHLTRPRVEEAQKLPEEDHRRQGTYDTPVSPILPGDETPDPL